MANKIKYGLKNVHYAIGSLQTNGSMTYSTPVPFPGAVSLSLEPQGDNSPFYADNIVYWVGASNTGYQGDLEIARVIDSFKKDVLGMINDGKSVLVEDANAPAVHFALLFQFEGDVNATKYALYNCKMARPDIESSTTEDGIEVQAVHFALLFQFEGDDKATKHVMYNCTATRPSAAGNTKAESVEPQTESVTITATSVYNATLDADIVKAEANGDSDSTTYSNWFNTVYLPTAPSTST